MRIKIFTGLAHFFSFSGFSCGEKKVTPTSSTSNLQHKSHTKYFIKSTEKELGASGSRL
jgi:nickel-dependent lactate racemase